MSAIIQSVGEAGLACPFAHTSLGNDRSTQALTLALGERSLVDMGNVAPLEAALFFFPADSAGMAKLEATMSAARSNVGVL